MKTLKEFALIMLILFIGQTLQIKYNLPIPGTILGMILLLLLLITRIVKLKNIENISKVLLDHLTFFFLPPAVGVMNYFGMVKDIWVYLLLILLASTIVIMLVTGLTVQALSKIMGKKGKKGV